MKKLLYILFLFVSLGVKAQLFTSWGGQYGYFNFPKYHHVSDLPATANPLTVAVVIDSTGSATVLGGIYFIDSIGRHPLLISSGGGGGGGSVSIGTSIGSSTAGSVLFVDGSNTLAQNNSAFFWDVTNQALGINTNAPASNQDIYHNESGNKIPAMILGREHAGAGGTALIFRSGRGSIASPGGPSANDTAIWIVGGKWNGSVWQNAADAYTKIVGTPSTTNMPSEWHFRTGTNATPSVLNEALTIDDEQTTNVRHLVAGSVSTISDANRNYNYLEVIGPSFGTSYSGQIVMAATDGVCQGCGPNFMADIQYNGSTQVGGPVIHAYKSNGTSGNYSSGWDFLTRLNGNASQTRVMRLTEDGNVIIGGDSVNNGERLKIVGLPQDSTNSIGVLTHEADSGTHNISFPQLAGKLQPYISSSPIWRATANGSQYSNSTTQTSLLPASSIGSLTIAANTMYAGESFTFAGWGYMQTNAVSQTLTISHVASGMGTPFSQILTLPNFLGSSTGFELTSSITILSTGSSGSCVWNFTIVLPSGNTIVSSANSGTINTTVSNTFDFKATWGVASASDGIALGAPLILKIE